MGERMNLKFLDFHECQNDFEKINHLYHAAFPQEERAPIQLLIQKANEGKGDFLAVYDDQQWVGLVYVITYQQLSYVFYLAIDDSFRGCGYGSQILQMLKQRYHHTIMLCIEEVKEDYDNYNQRVKRRDFYFKNGFQEGFHFFEYGVKYDMLYFGEELTSQHYDDLMIDYIGEKYKENRVFD